MLDRYAGIGDVYRILGAPAFTSFRNPKPDHADNANQDGCEKKQWDKVHAASHPERSSQPAQIPLSRQAGN
jgi:hypothetical protein